MTYTLYELAQALRTNDAPRCAALVSRINHPNHCQALLVVAANVDTTNTAALKEILPKLAHTAKPDAFVFLAKTAPDLGVVLLTAQKHLHLSAAQQLDAAEAFLANLDPQQYAAQAKAVRHGYTPPRDIEFKSERFQALMKQGWWDDASYWLPVVSADLTWLNQFPQYQPPANWVEQAFHAADQATRYYAHEQNNQLINALRRPMLSAYTGNLRTFQASVDNNPTAYQSDHAQAILLWAVAGNHPDIINAWLNDPATATLPIDSSIDLAIRLKAWDSFQALAAKRTLLPPQLAAILSEPTPVGIAALTKANPGYIAQWAEQVRQVTQAAWSHYGPMYAHRASLQLLSHAHANHTGWITDVLGLPHTPELALKLGAALSEANPALAARLVQAAGITGASLSRDCCVALQKVADTAIANDKKPILQLFEPYLDRIFHEHGSRTDILRHIAQRARFNSPAVFAWTVQQGLTEQTIGADTNTQARQAFEVTTLKRLEPYAHNGFTFTHGLSPEEYETLRTAGTILPNPNQQLLQAAKQHNFPLLSHILNQTPVQAITPKPETIRLLSQAADKESDYLLVRTLLQTLQPTDAQQVREIAAATTNGFPALGANWASTQLRHYLVLAQPNTTVDRSAPRARS
ncbi:MAG: hypothetical protein WCQ21_18770 [Verrucomicrobiota bacterium]|jgi:hypothetical protein